MVRGGGVVRWPRGPILFDFALEADTVDLMDLRWISPDFPAWQGKGKVVALSQSDTRTDYALSNLVLGAGPTLAAGELVAMVDTDRGLGMRDLALSLRDVSLEVARPYLDTLPFAGRLTGRVTADGFLDRMTLGGDVVLTDALVPGAPQSHFVYNGVIRFGGPEGAVFERFRLSESTIDLGTVRRVVPAMVLPGDMRLTGTLDGPWLNARFDGVAEHLAPNDARSRMSGSVRFDARGAVLGLALDADFPQISFDALRTGYPDLPSRGSLAGRITAVGPIDAMDIFADLEGEIGVMHARGRIGIDTPRLTATALVLDVERLDLQALLGTGQQTALTGRITATGVVDSLVPPVGTVEVALGTSRVGGFALSSVYGALTSADGLIRIDTAAVVWGEGSASARGTLGWTAPDSASSPSSRRRRRLPASTRWYARPRRLPRHRQSAPVRRDGERGSRCPGARRLRHRRDVQGAADPP